MRNPTHILFVNRRYCSNATAGSPVYRDDPQLIHEFTSRPGVIQIGVFADCNNVLIGKLEDVAQREEQIEMESHFCRYRPLPYCRSTASSG